MSSPRIHLAQSDCPVSSSDSIQSSGKSPKGGAHASGKACDLAVDREKAYLVLREAMRIGFTGIGVAQSGDGRFLHLDCITDEDDFHVPRPTLWSY